MGNVRVSSGYVMNLFSEPGTIINATGEFKYKSSPKATFQGVVQGTGTVSATVNIEYSNDGLFACSTVGGTISLSGTTVHADGFTSDSPWKYVRAIVTNITGTNATVQVYMGV